MRGFLCKCVDSVVCIPHSPMCSKRNLRSKPLDRTMMKRFVVSLLVGFIFGVSQAKETSRWRLVRIVLLQFRSWVTTFPSDSKVCVPFGYAIACSPLQREEYGVVCRFSMRTMASKGWLR
jgi:hypothetical protein